jgi:3-hydroxyisobutyrate dehydrogenase
MTTGPPARPAAGLRAGFIGLGDMGARMAHRILQAGFVLAVHDPRPDAAAELRAAGALTPGGAAGVAENSDVIGICVATDAQLHAVGRELCPALDASKTVLIHSSVAPRTAQAFAASLAGTAAAVLDAPVSGSRPAADAGTLTLMVGGDDSVLARVRPLLAAYAAHVFHAGPLGAGEAMKLTNNIMLHMNHLIVLEALRFARSQGISEKAVLEMVGVSTGRSWVTETWGLLDDMMRDHPQAGTEDLYSMMSKDMWQSVVAARESLTEMPLTALGVQVSRAFFRERDIELGLDRTIPDSDTIS